MQQHLVTSTIRHAGQDGRGPDKSTALSLSYTQLGIASIPDLGIANDGLLAGRELETDAELITLGWLKPTPELLARLAFEGDELPAIYPEDDAQERADLLSARLAEREAKRKAERDAWLACFPEDRTAFELAEDTGWVGGQLEKTPIIDRSNSYSDPTVYNRGFLRLSRPDDLRCLNFGQSWQVAFFPDGQQQVRHFECGKCINCVAWRKREIAHRYALVRGEWQTVATVGGFLDVDAASKWSDAQGDRADGQRHRTLRWNPETGWELVIVYNRILDAHAVKLTERDMNRKGLVGGVAVCSLSPAEFERMLPNEATHEGPSGKKRYSSHFTGWPGYEQTPNIYATSDPTFFVNDSNAPDPTELTSVEKERASMDVETQADLWAADWWADTDPINAGTFDDALLRAAELEPEHETVKAIREQTRYGGPTALLVDAIRYQADAAKVPYRQAYHHVLAAAGRPTPDPHCLQCGKQSPSLTTLHLCVGCDLFRY